MSTGADRDSPLARYLLGALPAAEQEVLEERLFSDRDLYEELEAVTDDLMHDYLSGHLTADERQRFEANVLAWPWQRERLELVRAMVAKVRRGETAPRVSRVPSWLAQAAVLAAFASALVLLRPRPPAPVPTAGATPAPSPTARREPPLVRLAEPTATADVVLPAAADSVRFEVVAREMHPSYEAVVRTLQGAELWRLRGLEIEREGAPVRFSVPAAILAVGEYVLSLEGERFRRDDPAAKPVVTCTLRVRRAP